MAEGVVSVDERPFAEMVAGFPPPIPELGMAARALIFEVLPETVEVVWPQQKTAGYGTGPRKMTEQFVWLAPYQKHLVFGFYYGAELPAPEGYLEGTGRLMRHVKVRTLADLESPVLRELLEVAVTHRVPPPKASRG